MNRRQFTATLALGLAAAAVPDLEAQKPKPRKLRCGHTGITWGFRPEDAERAINDVATWGSTATSRSATFSRRGSRRAGSISCCRREAAAAIRLLPGEPHGSGDPEG